ncbi:M23 family metallopeptidase [Myxococcota bacterium]|nr:M23 family metallopeptidase [Myxococcota bacterium]
MTVSLALLILLAPPPPIEGPFEPSPMPYDGPPPTWAARARPDKAGRLKPKYRGLIDLNRWPAEPQTPSPLDPARFKHAFAQLCGEGVAEAEAARLAGWIMEEAAAFKVDPALLAALVYRQSRCRPKRESDFGIGLAGLNLKMYDFKGARLSYHVLEDGAWRPREITFKYAWTRANLLNPQRNLHFAAGLLSMWAAQWPAIAGAFGSAPHRHFVSHYLWGDKVLGAAGEDRTLRTRRRLLAKYTGAPIEALGRYKDLALICPLEGAPRKIGSRMGDDRADGKRRHKGIDFVSSAGEPVRAVADGVVVVAGVDASGAGNRNLSPKAARRFPSAKMKAGGIFVMIHHAGEIKSVYMHLRGYKVRVGQAVKAGEVIGWVGQSGIKRSGAHLHFELRDQGKHVDPFEPLSPYLFDPLEMYRGRRQARAQRQVRAQRRRAAWRARRAAASAKAPARRAEEG